MRHDSPPVRVINCVPGKRPVVEFLVRFVDNGDGTVTDTRTGLMWEQKTDDGSIHDKDNVYTWSTGCHLSRTFR
jgi:hypothetical protein